MKLIKKLVKKYLLKRKFIYIDLASDVSMGNTKGLSFEFPVIIKNSSISNTIFDEGCKFYDCICYGNVKVGRYVSIFGPGTTISSIDAHISIGSFSSIGQNVSIQDSYHRHDKVSTYFMGRNIFNKSVQDDVYSKGPVVVEEDVWLGSNSVVLSGVNIGRGAIVGAGSVVTKDVPRYSIVVGNPARVIKKRHSDDIVEFLEALKWWEWPIDKIKANQYLFTGCLEEMDISQLSIK